MEIGAQFPPGTRVTQGPFGRQGSCELKPLESEARKHQFSKMPLTGVFGFIFHGEWMLPGQRVGGRAPGVLQEHLQCGLGRLLPSQGWNRSGAKTGKGRTRLSPLWAKGPNPLASSCKPPLPHLLLSQSSLRSSPCANWGTSSNWGSRRSSWNSLGRAPSLKKKNQSGERESLLSGEGKGSTDDDSDDAKSSTLSRPSLPRRAESLDYRGSLELPELLRVPSVRQLGLGPAALLPAEFHDCNGKMGHGPGEFFLRVDGHKEDALDYEDDMEDVSPVGVGCSCSKWLFHSWEGWLKIQRGNVLSPQG